MVDQPKSLGALQHRTERLARLDEAHVAELNVFVDTIRRERGLGRGSTLLRPGRRRD